MTKAADGLLFSYPKMPAGRKAAAAGDATPVIKAQRKKGQT